MRLMISRPIRAAFLGLTLLAPAALPFAPSPALARGAPESFADLAAQLSPAVVNISSTQAVQQENRQGGLPEMPMFPPGSPFEQFFRDFLERNRPKEGPRDGQRSERGAPQPERPSPRAQSLGSGFIVDSTGYVVTNNHVIEGADKITVTLSDNTTLDAKLVGKDEATDLALLKVTTERKLPFVEFGDSDGARVGDWVLAIGNPFGLGGTVTAGIISARSRDIRQGRYDDFIQTDAAINRGNSGGPLFTMDGKVVGINTAIYSPSGGSIGIGFSIPSNLARNVVAQIKDFGKARRGWLGVRIQAVTPDIADSIGLKDATGAMVAGVTEGSPAEKGKLRSGDVILKFNGQDIKEMKNLPRVVAETPIGQSVPVTVWRDGKEATVQIAVAEMPEDQAVASAKPDAKGGRPPAEKPTELAGLGLKLGNITDEMRKQFTLGADQKGVVVTEVAPNSAAAEKGLRAGDVIVEVQQEPVANPGEVRDRLDRVRKQNRRTALLLVQSADGMRWVALPLDGDKK